MQVERIVNIVRPSTAAGGSMGRQQTDFRAVLEDVSERMGSGGGNSARQNPEDPPDGKPEAPAVPPPEAAMQGEAHSPPEEDVVLRIGQHGEGEIEGALTYDIKPQRRRQEEESAQMPESAP